MPITALTAGQREQQLGFQLLVAGFQLVVNLSGGLCVTGL